TSAAPTTSGSTPSSSTPESTRPPSPPPPRASTPPTSSAPSSPDRTPASAYARETRGQRRNSAETTADRTIAALSGTLRRDVSKPARDTAASVRVGGGRGRRDS